MLTGQETYPRSEMPAIGKLGSISDRGNNRRGGLWAYSPYLREAAAGLARAEDLLDLSIEPGNLLVEGDLQDGALRYAGLAYLLPELIYGDELDEALPPGEYRIVCYSWSSPVPFRFTGGTFVPSTGAN